MKSLDLEEEQKRVITYVTCCCISVINYRVKTGQFETQLERNISLGKAKFLGLDHTFHIWFCFKLCGRITESRDRALLFQEVISCLRRTSFQFTRHLSAYSVPSTQHWTLEISMNKTWFLPSEVAGGRGVHMPVKCFCWFIQQKEKKAVVKVKARERIESGQRQ